jgi:hypothetical protein
LGLLSAGLFALLTTAYLLEDETVSALWGVGAIAWLGLSVWDVFRLTRRGTSPIGSSQLRRATVIAASLLILMEIVTFGLFRSAGERALASGWQAHRSGDCRTAVERYGRVNDSYKMSFTAVVASARRNARECRDLLVAQAARQKQSFPSAVKGYGAFLRAHPDSVLASAARKELADTEQEWAESYQQQLTAAARKLRTSVATFRRLGAIPKLSRGFDKADRQFDAVPATLEKVPPPVAVERAHDALVDGLDVGPDLAVMKAAISQQELCTAEAVLADLARETRSDLRRAQRSLQRSGFALDLSVLWKAQRTNRRLANGSFIVSSNGSGSNSMTIENEGPIDAVVALAVGSKPEMSVYVREGASYTISGVPDGDYRIFYTSGRDWSSKYRTFSRLCDFRKLAEKAKLTSSAFGYTVGTLTLGSRKPGPGEQRVRSTGVAPEDFPGGPG